MRRAGAVFIRRKIDSPVYKVVMRQYLSYLMEKRFPISWALEGTRSRNGKTNATAIRHSQIRR